MVVQEAAKASQPIFRCAFSRRHESGRRDEQAARTGVGSGFKDGKADGSSSLPLPELTHSCHRRILEMEFIEELLAGSLNREIMVSFVALISLPRHPG